MDNTTVITNQENNIKLLRTIALIMGLVGGGLNLITIFTNAYEISTVFGNKSITMSSYFGDLIFIVFMITAGAIVLSLFKMGVPQTVLGGMDLVIGIVVYLHVESLGGKSALVNVNIGAGLYLYLIAAAMILASGILFIVSDTKSKKAGTFNLTEGQRKARKIVTVCSCCIAGACPLLVLILVFGTAFSSVQYKQAATRFMDAAVEGNFDVMKENSSTSLKDNDGFMEAYDRELMGNSLMTGMGLGSPDSLSKDSQKELDRLTEWFAKNHVSSYEIKDLVVNDDDTATVKIDAKIQDLDIGNKMRDKAEKISSEYMEDHREEVTGYFLELPEKEAMAKFVDSLMPQIVDAMIEVLEENGTKSSEVKLTVAKTDGNYLVTEISYDD